MSKREYILDNFLGMSYQAQVNMIEYLDTSIREWGTNRVIREFSETFSDYQEKLRLLLEFKDAYPEFNSDRRRLTRKKALDELKESAFEHHISNSDERVKGQFIFSGRYYNEAKRYYETRPVSPEEVQEFLTEYEQLSTKAKREFIEELIFAYQRINHLELPNPETMLEEYKPIILSIIGKELMPYYNKLYKEEQLRLILNIVEDYRWFKIDEDYYNRKVNRLKDRPKVIRLTKQETLKCCKDYLDD